jgi:hypothetical protein
MSTPKKTVEQATDELVAFFRGLSSADRRELDALADRDRRFGEDVVAEQRERAKAARS